MGSKDIYGTESGQLLSLLTEPLDFFLFIDVSLWGHMLDEEWKIKSWHIYLLFFVMYFS